MTQLAKSFKVILIIILAVTIAPLTVGAKVDWEVTGAVQLQETPIAVDHSPEKNLTFLLTDQAKVLIYSADGTLVGAVPVDPAVTDIAISANGEQVYLINGKRKTLQTIDIDYIAAINIESSPFLGPAGARVAVVVFSDFQ